MEGHIRLYSDPKYCLRESKFIVLLYPFFGISLNQRAMKTDNVFGSYISQGLRDFTISSIEEADFAVFPMDYGDANMLIGGKDRLNLFLDDTDDYGLTRIIFFGYDSHRPINIKNSLVFRCSLLKSQMKPNEFAYPSWCEDIIKNFYHDELPPRQKNDIPSIGFAGYAATPFREYLSNIFHLIVPRPFIKGEVSTARYIALQNLRTSKKLNSNFIMRKSFWGTMRNQRLKSSQRNEYIRNIVENDYTLCARGAGNFSKRLYETLCCGRIPVFINTDCCLPYEERINWKKICIWVEENELVHINDIIVEFHTNLQGEEFIKMQKDCRLVWKEYLSPEGFFNNFKSLLNGG